MSDLTKPNSNPEDKSAPRLLLPKEQIREILEQANVPEFPENKLGLVNGSLIAAKQDMTFLGLRAGDAIPLLWTGNVVMAGPLTWAPDQIVNEIESGVWDFWSDFEEFPDA